LGGGSVTGSDEGQVAGSTPESTTTTTSSSDSGDTSLAGASSVGTTSTETGSVLGGGVSSTSGEVVANDDGGLTITEGSTTGGIDSGNVATGSSSSSDSGSTSGGTVSSGDTGDPSNGGSCSASGGIANTLNCREEFVRIKLNPVCPRRGNLADRLWYHQAAHPVLAVEARVSSEPLQDNLRSHFQPYLASVGPTKYALTQAVATRLMYTTELASEPLFGPRFPATIILDYTVLGNIPVRGPQKVWITVYVCDDKNRDGKCSDESVSEQLSNLPVTHQACRFPSAVPVDVWHC